MKSLRVLLLVHLDLVPPDKFSSKKEWEESECKTEYDVWKALTDLGHKVLVTPIYDDLSVIRNAVKTFKPHIAFNLLEEFNGQVLYEQNVVSYLELMGLKYTGCNPKGLILSRDKSIAKKLLSYHGIQTPDFKVFPRNKKITPSDLTYPLFVKALYEEASLGITQASIVRTEEELKERVAYLHEHYEVDVLVENFIEGRELYVSLLGNNRIKKFPIWELYFKSEDFKGPNIATYKVKWDFNYRRKYGVTTELAQPIDEKIKKEIYLMCERAYSTLCITGYARMDLRLTNDNKIYLLEANPNPDIGFQEDFSESAQADGVDYPQLINKILKLGLE